MPWWFNEGSTSVEGQRRVNRVLMQDWDSKLLDLWYENLEVDELFKGACSICWTGRGVQFSCVKIFLAFPHVLMVLRVFTYVNVRCCSLIGLHTPAPPARSCV